MPVLVDQRVSVHINSVLGSMPAVVVRDVTGESVAVTANPLSGESVFEVRYTEGRLRGNYTFAPERDLTPIKPTADIDANLGELVAALIDRTDQSPVGAMNEAFELVMGEPVDLDNPQHIALVEKASGKVALHGTTNPGQESSKNLDVAHTPGKSDRDVAVSHAPGVSRTGASPSPYDGPH